MASNGYRDSIDNPESQLESTLRIPQKKTLVFLGLFLVSQYGHAQHLISVYDGEGKEIGAPFFDGPFNNQTAPGNLTFWRMGRVNQ